MSLKQHAPRPLVSVIVPVFNHRPFLPEVVTCLSDSHRAGETRRKTERGLSVEIIFIDDGSTDGSAEFLDSARDESTRVIHQPNRGPSAARNAGLRAARGEFIQFLDADDLLAPHKLAHDVSFLQQHPHIDLVSGEAAYFRNDVRRNRPVESARAFGNLPVALLASNPLLIHAPMLRRRAAERAGEFDETLRGCEDWDFWLRLAWSDAQAVFVPGVRAYCRLHAGRSSRDSTRMLSGAQMVLQRSADRLRDQLHEPEVAFPLIAAHADWALRAGAVGLTDVAAQLVKRITNWLCHVPAGYSHAELVPSRSVICWTHVTLCGREENHLFARALEEWDNAVQGLYTNPCPAGVRTLLQCHDRFVRSGDPRLAQPARRASRRARELYELTRRSPDEMNTRTDAQPRPGQHVEELLSAIRGENVRRLLIYGAGEHTRWLLSEFDLSDFDVVGIIDDDARTWDTAILDIPVLAPRSAAASGCDAVLISSDEHEERLAERAHRVFPITRVYRLYGHSPAQGPPVRTG